MSKIKQDNLTATIDDSAIFLPSISSFYVNYISKQRHEEYVKESRIPFANGMEALNFFNEDEGNFHYKWALYSAGHASLDCDKLAPHETMIHERDRSTSWLLGDSGGFQIAKGVWEGDWKNPDCPKADKKRKQVLRWLDTHMDYSMVLDIPAWCRRIPGASEKNGIWTFQDAVDGTMFNHDYFMEHRKGVANGGTKFLNVLQGENHAESDEWYATFKKYCDPKEYPDTHFDGWAFGGQNMCDLHLAIRRIVDMHFDGLLQEGVHDVIHLLGMSKMEWALVCSDLQRAIRRHYNPSLMLTFDAASPFLATANARIYTGLNSGHRKKWTFGAEVSVDDKKYSNDNRKYSDVVVNEGWYRKFVDSPITEECTIKDICTYKPGDLNKQGNEGKTSWDSFSYCIQMGHNVWTFCDSLKRANAEYKAGSIPKMLISKSAVDDATIPDVLDMVFSCDKREDAHAIADHYSRLWMQVVGSRGYTGNRQINASGQFTKFFNEVENDEPAPIQTPQTDKLEALEETVTESTFSTLFK